MVVLCPGCVYSIVHYTALYALSYILVYIAQWLYVTDCQTPLQCDLQLCSPVQELTVKHCGQVNLLVSLDKLMVPLLMEKTFPSSVSV